VYKPLALIAIGALVWAFSWVGFTDDASAQSNSRLCKNLNAQLASLGSGAGGNSAKYRQYSNAVRKQTNQLNKAKSAARRSGCTGLNKRLRSSCRKINRTIKKMRANLAALKKQQARHAPKGARNAGKRNRIKRRLASNGCYKKNNESARSGTRIASVEPSKKREKKSKRRTLLEQVFGVRTYNNRGKRKNDDVSPDLQISRRYGTYRTLCVRKSDGYYFPISFSTVKDRFDVDEQHCQSMCPNHEVALYVHRMPSEDSEDMIAYRSETPYRSEAFAFAYRQKHNPNIQCRFSITDLGKNLQRVSVDKEKKKSEALTLVGVPNFRKDATDIPDAYDSEVGGLTLKMAQNMIEKANRPDVVIADREFNPERKIRIVGPTFFPYQ